MERSGDLMLQADVEHYRDKVISLQLEAFKLENSALNKLSDGRIQALRSMASFYIEQLEKRRES